MDYTTQPRDRFTPSVPAPSPSRRFFPSVSAPGALDSGPSVQTATHCLRTADPLRHNELIPASCVASSYGASTHRTFLQSRNSVHKHCPALAKAAG
eukprot:6213247-Pleurochrysis_carterae.AAC.6